MKRTLYVALFVLASLPIMAQTPIVANPTGTQTIVQPAGTSLNVNVINNVEDASQFSGSDIGAQINAAFSACPATQSCKVTLPPGHNYSYSTTFTIPGTLQYTELDCQGSALTFTGTGDASQVAQRNDADPTGAINNCRFVNGSGNTASLAAVHQFSRIWFAYNNDTFYGFNNPAGVGIEMDNNAGSGWPGYSERTQFYGNSFSLDTKGVQFLGSHGGTNSFARQVMVGTGCNIVDGQICISVEGNGGFQSADVYDSYIDARGNIGGSSTGTAAGRAISVINGGDIRTGVFNVGFEGPNTAYLTYIDGAGIPGISGAGAISGGGLSSFNSGTSDQFNVPQLSIGGFTLQSLPFQNADQQALNSKLLAGGNTLRFGIPDDTYNYGYFQLFKRTTSNPSDPEVDA